MPQDTIFNVSLNKDVFDKHFSIPNFKSKESNDLLSVVLPIISYALKTDEMTDLIDTNINKLYKEFVNKISLASDWLKDKEYSEEIIHLIQYALCLFCDERINDNSIENHAENKVIAKNFLLHIFFGDDYADKNFYLTINELCQNPVANLEVLEVYFWCINLGFENKTNINNVSQSFKQETTAKLSRILKRYSNNTIILDNAVTQLLINCDNVDISSIASSAIEDEQNDVENNCFSYRKFSMLTLLVVFVISFFVYVGFAWKLNSSTNNISQITKKLDATNIAIQSKLPISQTN